MAVQFLINASLALIRISSLLLILLSTALSASAAEPMKIVYFNNFAPFSWEENGKMQGILIDVLNEALQRRMGIPLSHTGYPWKRAQGKVQGNRADAFVTVPTAERRSYSYISDEAVLSAPMKMFTQPDSRHKLALNQVKGVMELTPYILVDYLGNGWAKQHLQGLRVDWLPSLDRALLFLVNGKADVIIGISQVIEFNISKMGLKGKLEMLAPDFSRVAFHLCIGKDSGYAEVLGNFDQIIRQMRASGELALIYDRYK